MKKLITLLLLFTITLFYSIPTQAYNIVSNFGVFDNDQAFVQTKNLFDEIWEQGTILAIDGSPSASSTRVRSVNFIDVVPSNNYVITRFGSVDYSIFFPHFYDINQVWISQATSNPFTTPSNAFYIKFVMAKAVSFTPEEAIADTDVQVERGSTATSYTPYGFLSLNDIFVDGNSLLNSNFSNGTTNWTLFNSTFTVSDNTATFIGTSAATQGIFQTITNPTSNSYFLIADVKSTSNLVRLDRGSAGTFSGSQQFHSGSGNYQTLSIKYTAPTNFNYVIRDTRTSNWDFVFVKNTNAINLNSLGIDNLTLNELNGLYQDFRYNSIYDQGFNDGYTDGFNDGFTDGFNDGYDEGFDDGVASDTSFAVGYALGLSQGADMETGSSLLILIVALIGFILMIIGFITKRGIFNLLSTGAFIVLGGLLVEFVGFIIIAIGLVLINIYYAFFGNV